MAADDIIAAARARARNWRQRPVDPGAFASAVFFLILLTKRRAVHLMPMLSNDRGESVPTRQAFHEAISRGADAWYAACFRITRNDAQAQDAVQEALLSAWSKRHQFQGTARLETWIHRIAINSALAQLRRQRPGLWTELDRDIADDLPTPVDTYAEQQLGRDLDTALRELSEFERVCFELKHLEQWRLKEIAQRLETGVGPVKQALFRAVAKLRASMADLCGET